MAATTDAAFSSTVSTLVLEAEINDGRFEAFSITVVAAIEGGALIFPTSLSWDLGRDGVGAGSATGLFVCSSLRDDVDAKALGDIQRIAETTASIKRVYFCSSHKLSEHRRVKIEQTLAQEVDHAFEIVCLGSNQLIEAANQRAPQALEIHYGPDIANTLRAIRPDPNDETEIRGLRLALISASADDSGAIRTEVYRNALLDALNDPATLTLSQCCKSVSESLKLHRHLAVESVRPHLDALVSDGYVSANAAVYQLTDAGLQFVEVREREAAKRLLSGRQAIRSALESAMGARLIDDHFARLWAVFEERMAQYFLSRGDALVAEIGELLGEAPAATETGIQRRPPLSFLEDLAAAVAATSSHVQQRDELYLATKDLFSDRTSQATEWLVRLCASFVAACALGLEHSSQAAIGSLLARTNLVLDTDVVLSLVGVGEPEHEAVEIVVNRWTELGGRVLVAEPVLEEVAYHAHIAQSDFDAVLHRLPGSAEDRLHVIENVFVRAFAELLAQRTVRTNQWKTYIG